MIKCDNCPTEAVYTCADSGMNPANYCAECLPNWLRLRAEEGHFPLAQAAQEEVKTTRKKKAAPSDADND